MNPAFLKFTVKVTKNCAVFHRTFYNKPSRNESLSHEASKLSSRFAKHESLYHAKPFLNGDAYDSFFVEQSNGNIIKKKHLTCNENRESLLLNQDHGSNSTLFEFSDNLSSSLIKNKLEIKNEVQHSCSDNSNKYSPSHLDDPVINSCGIQMLSRSLHSQLFPTSENDGIEVSDEAVKKIQEHLSAHDLWGRSPTILPPVNFKLPPLIGRDLEEHFKLMAEKQSSSYKQKLLTLVNNEIPEPPTVWNFAPGWTRYDKCGEMTTVDYPAEDAYVFDVEVCVREGHAPTLATAVSNRYWYSWCSRQLIEQQVRKTLLSGLQPHYSLADLVPLETKFGQEKLSTRDLKERVVVGHNVSYDRVRVKEQYFYDGTKLRFVDTMSMHIAVSGLTSYQRTILQAGKNGSTLPDKKKTGPSNGYRKGEEILEWQNVSSFNGLNDVHKLYCGGLSLDKEKRNIFVTGSLADIKENFQELTAYCARDTQATHRVLVALTPEFFSRFPHPVTFAGMLEMSTSILPINRNWVRYIQDSEDAYADLESELTRSLKREADDACSTMEDGSYKEDPWLWDLDWSVQDLKMKKTVNKSKKTVTTSQRNEKEVEVEDPEFDAKLEEKFRPLMETRSLMFKRSPLLPGYPAWYRSLCNKDDRNVLLGPSDITTSAQVVPKLLKLTWDGYPLHHSRELGWGYLVPGRPLELSSRSAVEDDQNAVQFPLKTALEMFPPRPMAVPAEDVGRPTLGIITMEEALEKFHRMTSETADPSSLAATWQAARSCLADQNVAPPRKRSYQTADRPAWHQGIGPYDVGVPGCWFFRLPHKAGVENNVGNPLAKDYLNKMEDGTLRATSSSIAQHVLKLNRMIIYWRNARDRILSQMIVWLRRNQLPRCISEDESSDASSQFGAIIPQVITSGTLTRRAVEPTWMTASNAYKDRLGSELKAMIQCPPGMCLVGADVDSQELWIASVIGDAHFAGQHGCTALGWMTLQGKKSEGTDMHSRTAAAASITRDQAKVMNYGRIYGAGERFAKTLLMQFNHRLSEAEATQRARQMYAVTKGTSVYQLNYRGRQLAKAIDERTEQDFLTVTPEELTAMRKAAKRIPSLFAYSQMTTEDLVERKLWAGGTESYMFNKLEEIAQSDMPETPVLRCRISRALEPRNVGKEFMTSRVNWVVQSSAVDYLHLMLVAMRYLFDCYKIEGRFCISIHDEVRYLVRNEDRFRAALALQITNLWTRSMFALMLNMRNLPQSVAFFSSVDIDTVLRKEVNMDCQTPSNPYGLKQGYGIPFGKSYDIYQILQATGGSLDP